MQQRLLVRIWSRHSPPVPALGVMWQEVDKQTEKDEQDVTGDSPLVLLRKVFSHMLWKKWINLELVFSRLWKIRVTGEESAAKLQCPRNMVFLLESIWSTSHLHFAPFTDRLPNSLNQLLQINCLFLFGFDLFSPFYYKLRHYGHNSAQWEVLAFQLDKLPATAINILQHYASGLK